MEELCVESLSHILFLFHFYYDTAMAIYNFRFRFSSLKACDYISCHNYQFYIIVFPSIFSIHKKAGVFY